MKKWIFFLSLVLMLPFFLEAHEILVNTQDGQAFVFDVDANESLSGLHDKIVALTDEHPSNCLIEISSSGAPKGFGFQLSRSQGGYLGYPRNYYNEVTAEQQADIHFIVTYLANKSLIQIAFAKGDLEAAGNRIDHIHPLRFLMTVFTNEELKVGVRNIRGKGWVWNNFTGGLKECLSTESNIGNMKDEYIQHFAQQVEIDVDLVYSSIQQHDWDEFIDLLITHIPRKGDHDRYDN